MIWGWTSYPTLGRPPGRRRLQAPPPGRRRWECWEPRAAPRSRENLVILVIHGDSGQDTWLFLRLVLRFISSDFDEQGRIFQHFSRSNMMHLIFKSYMKLKHTHTTFMKIQRKLTKFRKIPKFNYDFLKNFKISNMFERFFKKSSKWSCRSWKMLKKKFFWLQK